VSPLHDHLLREHRIQVPIITFPKFPTRHVRIAAQAYNSLAQYEKLATALQQSLAAGW
jgi:isopenicillin-N epimerase